MSLLYRHTDTPASSIRHSATLIIVIPLKISSIPIAQPSSGAASLETQQAIDALQTRPREQELADAQRIVGLKQKNAKDPRDPSHK
jgi:hypothetical protein